MDSDSVASSSVVGWVGSVGTSAVIVIPAGGNDGGGPGRSVCVVSCGITGGMAGVVGTGV